MFYLATLDYATRDQLLLVKDETERIYLRHAPIWWCVATVPPCLERLPGITFTISIWLEKSIKSSCLCSARCPGGQVCVGSLALEHVVINFNVQRWPQRGLQPPQVSPELVISRGLEGSEAGWISHGLSAITTSNSHSSLLHSMWSQHFSQPSALPQRAPGPSHNPSRPPHRDQLEANSYRLPPGTSARALSSWLTWRLLPATLI